MFNGDLCEDSTESADGVVPGGMTKAVVDAFEAVDVHHNTGDSAFPAAFRQLSHNAVIIAAVEKPGQLVLIGALVGKMHLDELKRQRHAEPAGRNPVVKILRHRADQTGRHEIVHREKTDMVVLLHREPRHNDTDDIVRHDEKIRQYEKLSSMIYVIARNGKNQPRAEQIAQYENNDRSIRRDDRDDPAAEPPFAVVNAAFHIQHPESADAACRKKEVPVENVLQRMDHRARSPVKIEGGGLRKESCERESGHGGEQPVAQMPLRLFLHTGKLRYDQHQNTRAVRNKDLFHMDHAFHPSGIEFVHTTLYTLLCTHYFVHTTKIAFPDSFDKPEHNIGGIDICKFLLDQSVIQ